MLLLYISVLGIYEYNHILSHWLQLDRISPFPGSAVMVRQYDWYTLVVISMRLFKMKVVWYSCLN